MGRKQEFIDSASDTVGTRRDGPPIGLVGALLTGALLCVLAALIV